MIKIIALVTLITVAWAGSLSAASTTEQSFELVKKFINKEIAKRKNDALTPDWLSRVEFELDVSSEGKPEYNILTVQPLFQTEDLGHTVFTQVRLAHDSSDRTTGNMGLGYRRLAFDEKIIFGVNSFFDYEWPYGSQRASGGVEVISSSIEFRSNIYKGLSDWHTTVANTQERPMDGVDVELGTQIPFLPWAYLFVKQFSWSGVQDVKGETYSVRLRPTNAIEVELGRSDDDKTTPSNFAQVRYKVKWGGSSGKKKIRLIDDKAFRFNENVKSKVLEKVRRENSVRVEKRTISGSEAGTVTVSVARGT